MSKRARRRREAWRDSWAAFRSQPRRVGLVAVPWLLSLLIGFPLLWAEVDHALRRPAQQAGRDAVGYTSQTLLRWMNRLRDDARFLADLTPRLAEAGAGPDAPLVDTYVSFLQAGRNYHKVRWIDAAGWERLRIDQQDGAVLRTPENALQDKSARPFFHEGLMLEPGQVHLSPLDLNVESERIEYPPRPTLRASSPFVRADGSRGLVVVNIHGEVLLQRLREQAQQGGFTVYLVHPGGYWLMGPRPEDAWGWQLGRPERNVADMDPQLWQAMQRSPVGRWQDWTFSTLEAAWGDAEGDLLDHADPTLGKLRLLVRYDAPSGLRWKVILLVLTVGVIVIAALVVSRLARGMAREAAFIRRLRETNHALGTANRRLQTVQEGLARAERLSSLGLMVAGVAHEMNTPLGSAHLALSAARHGVEELEKQLVAGLRRSDLERFLANAAPAIAQAENEVRRAAALVRRFKQVAVDRASLEHRPFDLAEIVLDADPRLRRGELEDDIALVLDLESGLLMDSYPGPLEQVVSNLLSNALAHAWPQGGPGRIRIRAAADGSDHVRIEVDDDGRGIPAEDLPRIFEPFFTTRRNRGGTGLGLHIVHQIVTEVLGGTIEVRSRTSDTGGGRGTRFVVRLPRVGPERTPLS